MTDQEYKEWVWSKMALDHSEFPKRCDPFDDPWMVENLILNTGYIAWQPFAGANAMDVGANVGIWGFHAALHGANVTAYEADPLTHAVLQQTAKDLSIQNLTALNKAIWIFNGTTQFLGRDYEWKCRGRNGSLQSLEVSPSPVANEIECITFDDAIGDVMWDCVKMDIEGAEFPVLENVSTGKLSQIRTLHVEFHNSDRNQPKYALLLKKLASVFNVASHSINNEEFQGRYHWAQFSLK